uniref:CBF1-interacting co-repressor CIR N-terminal domain-containing protein n=1 Tax=Heliothis virescens TaxID=7102 RepID=A0A2A4JPD2_HELVI
MNILPKKRWHVRTKENIARVRKDEAEAAEKEKQEQLRVERADREARLQVLKQKSRQKLQEFGIDDEPKSKKEETIEHINLFANLEDAVKTTNKEHDHEVKEKKEEYEKKIGYLTYLGQDTNEALGKKNWYEVPPEARASGSTEIKDTYDKLVLKDKDGKPKIKEPDEKDGEIGWKKKQMIDPMNAFKHLHDYSYKDKKKRITKDVTEKKSKHKKKDKKHKKDDKEEKLRKLREARLKREQEERYRTQMFLKGLHNPSAPETVKDTGIKPKYNSQFNPELARQNYR